MPAATSFANFGYFATALIATAAVAVAAGIQFLLVGWRRGGDRTSQAFAVLCLCVATLAFGRAGVYSAQTLPHAMLALRVLAGAVLLALPALMFFVAGYTNRPMPRRLAVAVLLLTLGMSVLNLFEPGTVMYASVQAAAPLQLPWGETLYAIDGTRSASGRVFYWLCYAAFAWTFYRALRQCAAHDQRLRGAMLLACLLVQFLALLWSTVVIDAMGRPYPATDAFAFLSFVLLMGLWLVGQMRTHTAQLERTAAQLRAEAATRHQAEQSLRHAAWHDALTGLPNRLHALDRLCGLLDDAERSGLHGSVLLVDLDHFKTINESLGHRFGDLLLQAVAERLSDAVPDAIAVARLGGDEFLVLLCPTSADAATAARRGTAMAAHVLAHLAKPLVVERRPQAIGASIGVASFPDAGVGAADIVRRADIALHRAKAAGRHAARLFEPQMQAEADVRLELERGLRLALQRDELTLHFQPQVDAAGRLAGAEALLRWRNPAQGMLLPGGFIHIAEETGLIHALGLWVVDAACSQLREWHRQGLAAGIHLSINVSPWQITQPQFADDLAAHVRAAGIEPAALTLELTESALLGDFDAARQTLQQLSDAGFRLSLDDFGTGYSSLASLQQLPLDELKIDRSFVLALQPGSANPLAGFIVDIGKRLGMTTVAEGVETAEQQTTLAALGCNLMQGHFIGMPMPAEEFQHWLAARHATDAVPVGAP
ncbi:EAL domain-containing protein [Rhodanobacter sp. DHB23]|uniref:putative bifunctional diguanylate cyclase/phosphodiesterase n=1 Tax=Rhodanobacter sp. DHB23 TaxID=2775923 RepID=UPI0017822CFB|nr:EAL domain-containing protein [Rhodanobacter sp. DHB23]MBD8872390.1 EAL domain-containing protein [Rhodanobacter sp. DHB23]